MNRNCINSEKRIGLNESSGPVTHINIILYKVAETLLIKRFLLFNLLIILGDKIILNIMDESNSGLVDNKVNQKAKGNLFEISEELSKKLSVLNNFDNISCSNIKSCPWLQMFEEVKSSFQYIKGVFKGKSDKNLKVVPLNNINNEIDIMKIYTINEVRMHNREDDCWIIIENDVYNLTEFLYKHPGGKNVLFENAGKDVTENFEAQGHSEIARDILQTYLIGTIDICSSNKRKSNKSTPNNLEETRIFPFILAALVFVLLSFLYIQNN